MLPEDRLGQGVCSGQDFLDQDIEIGAGEEFQPGLALSLPQLAIRVDDAVAS